MWETQDNGAAVFTTLRHVEVNVGRVAILVILPNRRIMHTKNVERNATDSPLYQYVLNTSFHGIRYLAERDRHWTERLFWLICCVVSWVASGLLMKASWYDFQNNAISFVVDTGYLNWDTKFPSIAVCETDNQERITEFSDKLYGVQHDYNFDELVRELVYFKGLSYYTLQLCGSKSTPDPNCIYRNFSMYESLVRSSCSQIFQTCKWSNVEFDCCKYFTKVKTELGTCYGINMYQARNPKSTMFPMLSNRFTGPGSLYIELNGYLNVYLLSEHDVPSLTSLPTDVIQISPHIRYRRFLAVKEIDNQPEVRDVSIEQRNCRFPEESNIQVYSYYSYSACTVQCRKNAQMDKCNCTYHYMPNSALHEFCDIDGLECLNRHYNDLAVLKTEWSSRSGLVCACIPSCTEIEMYVVRDHKTGIPEEYSIVELSLERLPTERFKRKVVRGKLDLVVSLGGSAGLFVGASVLSFVEIIYYFTLRVGNNHLQKRATNLYHG